MKKRNIGAIVFRTFLLVLAAVMIGVGIYNINSAKLVGDQMPMPLGFGVSVVLSGSMEPELSVNDLVIIRKTDEIAVNDVIVFQSGNSLVIHRVIAIEGDAVITKGDANNAADSPIPRSAVKGKLVFTIPGVGVIVDIIRTPAVTLLLIAAVIYLTERSFRKEKEKDASELSELKKEIEELTKEINEKDS